MSDKIIAFKGFDKDLKCRGFQFEIGKEYEEVKAEPCSSGFHACEHPLDVFEYYPPGRSRYCEVEQSGDIKKAENKTASTKIKIGAELSIAGLVNAAIEYTRSRCTNEYNAEPGLPATAGEYGAATSRGKSCTGDNGVCVARGNDVMVKGGKGSLLVIAEEGEESYDIVAWKVVLVDGVNVKADTWYKLVDGKLKEA